MIIDKDLLIGTYEAMRLSAASCCYASVGAYGSQKKVVAENGVLAWAIRWGQLQRSTALSRPLFKQVAEQPRRQFKVNDELKNVLTHVALKLVQGGQYGNGIWE